MTLVKGSALTHILRQQIAVGLLGFLLLAIMVKMNYALSFLCGVALMIANGWWLARRLEKTSGQSVEASQRTLYAGAAIRFLSLIAGLILAHLIGLHLLIVASGMFVAQVVVFVSALVGFGAEQASSVNKVKNKDKGDGFG